MIEIEAITIRNFQSFGDTPTTVKLSDLKSCLITGEVEQHDDNDEVSDGDESNGVGKSSFTNAILWALTGKTMHSENPGDHVINYFNGKDCNVILRLKNNDVIERSRKGKDGHDDLLYHKNGEDVSLGTTKMQQAELYKSLNFDYIMFRGSAFFAQYAKPWLEMSSITRKEALEREFHIDRMQLYADVAKENSKEIESEQSKIRTTINGKQLSIHNLTHEMEAMANASASFDADKKNKIIEAKSTLARLEESRDSIIITNIDELRSKWDAIAKIEQILLKKREAIYELESQKRQVANDIVYQDGLIKKWVGKAGICTSCEQPITSEYVGIKTDTPSKKKLELSKQLTEITSNIEQDKQKLSIAQQQLDTKKPTKTIASATQDKKEWDRRNQNVLAQLRNIAAIEAEENHYQQAIDRIKIKIVDIQSDINTYLEQLKKLDISILHWNYIYKAYSDRRKIKSYVLCDYIPYLNERIAYYLDRFKMKLRIEFTDGLGVRSNYWDYNFFCGGERKRVDIAMMLAMFDLHTVMYGRQCNIIVLDEVDGRLDRKGAKLLVDIVKNDLTAKVDTVLVISHRSDMRGVFDSEIRIKKDGDISYIKEILR